jgi:hypothetical protein
VNSAVLSTSSICTVISNTWLWTLTHSVTLVLIVEIDGCFCYFCYFSRNSTTSIIGVHSAACKCCKNVTG